MAETAPNSGNPDSYPKGLDIYNSFDQVTTGTVRKKNIPIGVTEDEVKVPLTAEHILHSYGYGPEDLPKKEQKKNKLWEEPTKVDEEVEESSAPEMELNIEGYPKPATWDSHHDGIGLKIQVLGEYPPDSEGKVTYKIDHPVAEGAKIPKDELRFIIEPGPENEASASASEKKNKKVEDLPAKERALHPETTLRLKEKFDQRLKSQMKDLESLKNTGRLAELYEQAEKTTSDLLRAAVVSEYLDDLSEEDRATVEPLFNDLVNEMNSSEDALEIKRKMMGEPAKRTNLEGTPNEEVEKSTKFKEGQKVKVLRTNGSMESDWVVESDELETIDGVKYITVMKKQEDGTLYKDVPEEDLEKWQNEEARTEPLVNEGTPPTDASESSSATTEEEKGWLRKKWDRVKYIAGWPAEKAVTYITIEGDPNSPENQKKRRRAKAGLIAGAILVPLALLAAYKLGMSHSDVDGGGSIPGPDTGSPPAGNNNGSGEGLLPGVGDGGLGGSHHEVFNNDQGNRIVESILPNNLEQSPIDGWGTYEQIVDKNTGETIVDHATYAGNGRYSIDTIKDLKEAGYNVGTNTIELGDTTHKVSVVQKA